MKEKRECSFVTESLKKKRRNDTEWQLAVADRASIRPCIASYITSRQKTALCTKWNPLRKIICKVKREKRASQAGNKHRFA